MKQSELEKMIFSKYGNPNGDTMITKLGTEYESHYSNGIIEIYNIADNKFIESFDLNNYENDSDTICVPEPKN